MSKSLTAPSRQKDGISQHLIFSPLLAKHGCVHGFSTRTVGFPAKSPSAQDPAKATFPSAQDSANATLPSAQDSANATLPAFAPTGLQRLRQLAGMPDGRWVLVRQVHGAGVVRAGSSDKAGRLARGQERGERYEGERYEGERDEGNRNEGERDERFRLDDLPEGDALVTNRPGLLLAIRTADCVPILIGGPGVVAAVHAGWRGTVARVVIAAIQALESDYNLPASALYAAIGPSIGAECYEVGQEVADGLNDVLRFAPGGIEGVVYSTRRDGSAEGLSGHGFDPTGENAKYRVDLKEANRRLLLEAGLRPEAVEVLDLCTACNPEHFFSYRREKGTPGRMVNFIGIADSKKGA